MYKKSVQEVGRSILEMLGVLAIVGILSVVGVVGWQYGMDKYAANDVLNEANIRGFDVLANYKDRKLPDLTMLPGYQKKTTTGRPIFVIPNPSDFNWAEYPEKCESADYCQAFDVEVRGITERQCEIIMNSDWRLPDSIFVSQTPQNTTMTTPLAITASADRIAKRTTAKLNSGLCHFTDSDIDLTLRFRFVSTYTDFSNTKDDGGWDETTPTPDDGETGGGESVEEEPEDTSCPTGQERNDKGDCVCKPNHYGESCIECLSPRKWDDIYGCICAGVKSVWDSGEKTCVCPANHYGANCVRCMEPREWVNNDCICNGPKSVWNNETQLCECPKNYYTEDCSVYCAGEYASWNGTACVCSFRNSEWSPTERACVCKDDYYGTNCDYCAGKHTKWDDGNNRCICTLQNSTWNKDKNVCECLNNYYGSNCDYCAGTHASWNSSTNKCECSLTHSHWTGSACVCDTDYYGPSCVYCAGANSKWDSTNNKCTCTLANSTWNTTQNKCICNTNYYGPSCTYCAGNYTKWDSTNNKCTCTQSTREWNGTACVCKTGYYGDNCTYCAGDYTKWDTTTNSCTCTLANSSWDAINKKCVCINGTTWSESKKSCVTPGSTEDTCYAPRVWINGICTCPTTTPYYKSSTNECLKCYQVNESKPYWNGSICTICPSDKPYWDTNKKECVACATFNVDTPVWDGTNNKCISCYASNNAKPYWNGTKCIACYEKSTSTPVWSTSKNQCVSCVTLDSTKPAWSTTNKKCDTCYAVNNAKPKWNTSTSACEACPTANPYWDGTQCTILSTWCGNQIKNIGLTNYSASGDTVTYNTNMTVSKNLDISDCNLVVKGTLTVNSGITLKAKNVSATSSTANGINNAGTMTVTNKIYGNGYAYGVHNQSTGKMTAGTLEGNHTREYTENVTNTVLLNDGTMNIDTIKCNSPAENSISIASFINNGTLTATHVVGKITTERWAGTFLNVATATIEMVDLGGGFVNAGNLNVTKKLRSSSIFITAGTASLKDVYTLAIDNLGGTYSFTADRIVVKNSLHNYGQIINARIVYVNTFQQAVYFTCGLHSCTASCARLLMGPGTTKVSNSFNHCSGLVSECGRVGTVTGTYQKKCMPTCSSSTPIWNGESCEGCPSIRPNWNAEYGICE